jgi:hypothetical protein
VHAKKRLAKPIKEKSSIVIKQDRRTGTDRRKKEQGPPPGGIERRITMQRRMFDIPLAGPGQWAPEKNGGQPGI